MQRTTPLAIFTATFLFLGASPAPQLSPNPAAAPPVDIDVSVLTSNCADFHGVLTYTAKTVEQMEAGKDIRPTRSADGVYHFSFMQPPGHYWLEISTPKYARHEWSEDDRGFLGCITSQMFTVIPKHARHLVVSLGDNQTPHPNCSLAGTLPAQGFGVALIIPKGEPVPDTTTGGTVGRLNESVIYDAVIDGDAYYIEHISAWKYVLRISAGMSGGDIRIDLSKGWYANNPYCSGVFIHNVTPAELKGLFPPNWATE